MLKLHQFIYSDSVAQLGECHPDTVEVIGSRPVRVTILFSLIYYVMGKFIGGIEYEKKNASSCN